MKKIMAFIMVALFVFCFTGCSTATNNEQTLCNHVYIKDFLCEDSECIYCGGIRVKSSEHDFSNGQCICGEISENYLDPNLIFGLVNGDSEYSVITYKGTASKIIIPPFYNNKKVTTIGESAFFDCNFIESISIPNTIICIEERAFEDCNSLTSIIIPNSVTKIERLAFYTNSALTIYCENAEKPIGWDNAWNRRFAVSDSEHPIVWNCKSNDMTKDGFIYTIQNGLRYKLKNNIAEVTNQPRNITSAIIKDNILYKDNLFIVTGIETDAFEGCNLLSKIITPNSIINIDGGIRGLEECESLSYAEKGGLKYLGNNTNPFLYLAEAETSSMATVEIDKNCKFIGCQAFYRSNLQTIEIPEGVLEIGDYAFAWSTSLASIEMPNTLISIGYDAFQYCRNLKNLIIPNSVTKIDHYAFSSCENLISVALSNNIVHIGNYAFAGCKRLGSIHIPKSTTYIGKGAFMECANLVINCELTSTPTSWHAEWNKDNCHTVWGIQR